jgi:hypothetical protein
MGVSLSQRMQTTFWSSISVSFFRFIFIPNPKLGAFRLLGGLPVQPVRQLRGLQPLSSLQRGQVSVDVLLLLVTRLSRTCAVQREHRLQPPHHEENSKRLPAPVLESALRRIDAMKTSLHSRFFPVNTKHKPATATCLGQRWVHTRKRFAGSPHRLRAACIWVHPPCVTNRKMAGALPKEHQSTSRPAHLRSRGTGK